MATGTHDMIMFWNLTALPKLALIRHEVLLDSDTYWLAGTMGLVMNQAKKARTC